MKYSRKLFVGFALSAAVFSAGWLQPQPAAAQEFEMKVAAATINDAQFRWMNIFKEGVEAKAGDRIKVSLFPASQLGPIPRMVDGVLFGTIESFVTATAFLVGTEPKFQIFDAPGLYDSAEHTKAVLHNPEFRSRALAYGENKGFRSIAIMFHSPFAVASKTPIRTLADFKGQKIRTFGSPLQIEPFKALGASPVPMPLTEVLPALQSGNIDGLIAGSPIMYAFKYYDAAPWLTIMPGWPLIAVATVNAQWFDGLPADLQEILLDEAQKAEEAVFPFSLKAVAGVNKLWTDNGGQITELSAADQALIVATMKEITEPILKSNPAVAQEFETLQKVVEARR